MALHQLSQEGRLDIAERRLSGFFKLGLGEIEKPLLRERRGLGLRAELGREQVGAEFGACRENAGSLDDMGELANIAGIGIGQERPLGLG